jgi:hypothetical protein
MIVHKCRNLLLPTDLGNVILRELAALQTCERKMPEEENPPLQEREAAARLQSRRGTEKPTRPLFLQRRIMVLIDLRETLPASDRLSVTI